MDILPATKFCLEILAKLGLNGSSQLMALVVIDYFVSAFTNFIE